jgi:hypothetical protein
VLNKLVKPGIPLTMGYMNYTTCKLIVSTTIRWGMKARHEIIRISSRPDQAAPKTQAGKRNFQPKNAGIVFIRIGRRRTAHEIFAKIKPH